MLEIFYFFAVSCCSGCLWLANQSQSISYFVILATASSQLAGNPPTVLMTFSRPSQEMFKEHQKDVYH